MIGIITSVNKSKTHSFSKDQVPEINLLEGLGVEEDVLP